MTEDNRTQHDLSSQADGRRTCSSSARMMTTCPRLRLDMSRGPPASPTGSDRLVLTVDEAAYLLNISRGLAYELVARGELPAIRLGRRIVIPRVAMEELLGTPIR